VVGGGVIGCSIAYHLTKAGVRDVVLLERKELTAGTTWHAAGLITSAGMPNETFLWMSRYTAKLLPQLTEETGQETGFRRIGHLHLACTPQRVETVTREAIFAKAHGVPIELVGPEEVQRLWPTAKVDDIITAAWVPDEGRANPADVTQAYAKGARMGGAQIVEGVTVTGFVPPVGATGSRPTGIDRDRDSGGRRRHVAASWRAHGRHGAAAGGRALLSVDRHRGVGTP
jgi:4-methylaminobutanoate oxidase (formaldehyde-forming)